MPEGPFLVSILLTQVHFYDTSLLDKLFLKSGAPMGTHPFLETLRKE